MMREERFEDGTGQARFGSGMSRGLSEFKIDLGDFGRFPTRYHFEDQLLTVRDPLILPGAFLKWYELRPSDESIPDCLLNEAQALIAEEVVSGHFAVDFGVGFVVMHYSPPHVGLVAGSWHEDQEFRETRYSRDMATGIPFERTDDDGEPSVWDLAPLSQERQAWARYLFPTRHNSTRQGYLSELLSSAV